MKWQFKLGTDLKGIKLENWIFETKTHRFSHGQTTNDILVERNIHLRYLKLPSGKTHITQNPTLELHVGAGRMLRETLHAQLDLPLSMQAATGDSKGPQDIESPMTGKILKILVEEGSLVEKGQALLTVEAMKMENQILAPMKGKVQTLCKKVSDGVISGEVLVIIDAG